MTLYSQEFPIPLNGLDDREPTGLDPTTSPNLRNVRTVRERVIRGPGAALWATVPATEVPNAFAQASFLTKSEAIIMATQLHVYTYNTGTGQWVALAGTYTGATSKRFSFANTQDRECWSQGSDNIQVYDNTNPPSQLVAVAAPTILPFNNRVLALNTLEADGLHNVRVRWCVNGVITDWVGLGSGFLEIIQTGDDPLTGGFVLGNQCMLGKSHELIELVATGDANSPFAEGGGSAGGVRVPGTGLLARYSAATAEYFAFFLGPDQIYMWDGASLHAIGQRVYKTITGLVDYNGLTKVQGVVHQTDSEYWLLVSETAEGGVFIYDYQRERWFRDDWPNVSALGVFRIGSSLLNQIQQSEFVIVGTSTNNTVRVDPTLFTNNGVVFQAYVDTPDFTAQNKPQRGMVLKGHTKFEKNALSRWRVPCIANQAFQMGYSVDKGVTYTMASVTANADGIATQDAIAPFNRIRFRALSNLSQDWEISHNGDFLWQPGGMEL